MMEITQVFTRTDFISTIDDVVLIISFLSHT